MLASLHYPTPAERVSCPPRSHEEPMSIVSVSGSPAVLPLLEVRQLSRVVQEGEKTRPILRDLSLRFAPGELVVIVGKSGSGKSTLLNLLGGIDLPSQGSIWMNGVELTALSEQQRTLFRRQHIGFIFQFFNLVPTLTVLENLLLPLELLGVSTKQGKARALELLEQVKLADRAHAWPDRLSGGEQQRVAIARALIHDPLLVLADEPTGNLDQETGQHVLSLLDSLTRRAGKNLIMVTHSLEVVGLADRVFRMREGQLEALLPEKTAPIEPLGAPQTSAAEPAGAHS